MCYYSYYSLTYFPSTLHPHPSLAGISSTSQSSLPRPQQSPSPHPQQSPSPHLQQQSAGFNFAPSHHHHPHTTPPQSPLTQQLLASSTPTHTVTHPPGMYVLHQEQQGHTPSSRYPGQLNPQDQVMSRHNQGLQEVMRHNLFHLGNNMNVGPSSVAENAMLNRAFLAHQHQQQLFAGSGHHLSSFPPLHQLGTVRPHSAHSAVLSGRYAVGSNVPLGLPGQLMPTLGATGAAQMVGKVRAPVPSNVQLQDSSQRDSPPTPLVYSQSHLQDSPSLPQRTHLPSQQVT